MNNEIDLEKLAPTPEPTKTAKQTTTKRKKVAPVSLSDADLAEEARRAIKKIESETPPPSEFLRENCTAFAPPNAPEPTNSIEQLPDFDELPPRQNATKTQSVATKSFADLIATEYKPNWLIEGVIEHENLGLIFGNSASGKSLIVQDMSYCIAAGLPFHEKPTQQGNVLYVCGEGFAGLKKRFQALHEKYKSNPIGLHFTEQPAEFMDADSAKAVRQRMDEIGNISLVVIDTFHRNFGAGDENSARDFGAFLNNIDLYIKSSGAAVLIVHHCGNEANGRSRGSSSIRAAMDVEYQVEKDKNDVVTMTNTKMKDFEPPKPMAFTFEKVGHSVVLETAEFTKKTPVKSLSKNASKSLSALHNVIEDDGISPPKSVTDLFKDSPQNIPKKVVTLEQWRTFAYEAITVDSDTKDAKKKTFQRARADLENVGDIGIHGSYVWLAYAENNNHI